MNIRSLIIILFSISCIFSSKGWSQDTEFSQFYAAPLHLNPAMIGFSAEPKVVINYRHQQASFANAFLSFAASYDQHFYDINSSIGVSLFADRAGGGLYNTYYLNGYYAYQVALNKNLSLKTGVQVGYINQSINWNDLVFRDMINPLTGETFTSTAEEIPDKNSIHKLDLGLGAIAYTDKLYVGASFKHVTQPNLSFTNEDDPLTKLGIRTSLHAGYTLYLEPPKTYKSRLYVSPNLLFISQSRFFQLNVGSYVGKGPFYGGIWLRHTIANADALILMLGTKIDVVKVGYSYDVNLKKLGTTSGAHELSLIFDFGDTPYARQKSKNRRSGKCPEIF